MYFAMTNKCGASNFTTIRIDDNKKNADPGIPEIEDSIERLDAFQSHA